jgi:long-subunit fatty acid transport protein
VENKMKKWIIIYLLIQCFFIVPKNYAQTEVFFLGHGSGVGGRALSMGSAYLAISDDYSATLWNPAGLTQLRRMELFTSLSHLQYANEASFINTSNTDKTTKTKLNSIGFAFPIPTYRGSLVLAIGYNQVRSFDAGFSFTHYVDTLDVQQTYTELEEGGLNNWVFAGALEVTKNLSVGAALNLWRGKDDYTYDYFEQDIVDIYTFNDFNYTQQIVTKYQAVNFKLAALYKFGRIIRFGATISTPVSLNAKEDWSQKVEQTGDQDFPDENYEDGESASWDYGLRAPFVFAAGAAFTLLPNIVLSADVEYNDWSQTRYTSEPPVGEEFQKNINFKQDFEATTTYRFGGEFTVPLINTQLRAGLIRQPSPLINASSKSDRNYLTVGGGILLDKQVKIDFAWVHGWWEREDSYFSAELPSVDENISIDKFFATMSIRF